MSTPLRADVMQLPADSQAHNAWNAVPGSVDTVLFANNDLNNTWYLGFRNTITVGGNNTIPIPPSGTVSMGANRTVYAVAPVGTTPLIVIPGGGAYFQGLTQGQGVLVLPSIRSPNFVHNVSGWSINKDGSAEFNNLLVRGALVVSGGSSFGLFIYNGTPAFGNLPIFWASSATTDPFGNAITPTAGVQGSGQFTAGTVKLNSSGLSAATGNFTATLSGGELDFIFILATLMRLTAAGLFLYTSPGGAGTLITSLASAAGTDPFGNGFPQGLLSQQLTLQNQSVAPPAFAGASVFYSGAAGRPRYKSSAGSDNIIERADVNTSQVTIGNVTVFADVSIPINYQANEGGTSSEYEIEIDCIVTTAAAGAANTLTFRVAVDGTTTGGAETIGAVFLVIASTFASTVRGRVTILSTGAVGSILFSLEGSMSKQGVNAGSSTTPVPTIAFGANSNGSLIVFDTTVSHTITIQAAWGGLNAGQQITSYRSRLTRRN